MGGMGVVRFARNKKGALAGAFRFGRETAGPLVVHPPHAAHLALRARSREGWIVVGAGAPGG